MHTSLELHTCVFKICNLPPALLAEWLGSVRCYHRGGRDTEIRVNTEGWPGEENSPATPAWKVKSVKTKVRPQLKFATISTRNEDYWCYDDLDN